MNMRMLCRVVAWSWLLLLAAPLQASAESSVSMAFEDSPIPRVLQALADHQQLNVVIAPGVTGNLSLRLADIPWQQALDIVLRMGKLSVERNGNVLMVFPADHLESLQKERDERVAEQAQKLPLHNLSVALQYADATEVAASVLAQRGTLLSTRGSVTVDKRTNTLLIRDTEEALAQLEPWVKELDLPLAQVQLAAHIVTISSEHLQALGVNWGLGEGDAANKALRLNNFNVGLPVDTPAINAGFHLARLNGRLLDLELMALEQESQVEIIASPRLFTAHQQTASIKQGTEIPYQVSSGASGSTSIEFKEAVLGMEVTPDILRAGRITLNLKISQNMPGQTIKQGDNGEALAIDKQEIQTQVTVADGETIVLGGIFQQQKKNSDRQVPILGEVPVFGHLFRNHTQQHTRRELVIFITPTLIPASS
ncbi:DNA uptake porin HofQ [Pectobacterium versatile]|uniref:DNA uptake porin HofQ n=1 Tax=Pectobacterium versatile TaxID=2488639 RepID=UPI000D19C435|nr:MULTISPECIES: DNA uptake porin HofQ [Pectobacterium]AVT60608.1 putative DNA transport protein HofQ [Pectobacterium versatile]MBN3061741.1 DNA uptake porin HofQ [Pectobacterium versatile]MCA5933186.1 DNA uptake porin HofQ [Pectobacterium versatile]MCA5950305.1 DNA uptake porin HofQ [Pectobacterium versatile]MCA5954613.1 DNA uptake porin HofQ [Pectobacterium versatile]